MIKNILNTYYHNRVRTSNTELVKGCGERTISEALQCYGQGERGGREEREGREGGREGGRERGKEESRGEEREGSERE